MNSHLAQPDCFQAMVLLCKAFADNYNINNSASFPIHSFEVTKQRQFTSAMPLHKQRFDTWLSRQAHYYSELHGRPKLDYASVDTHRLRGCMRVNNPSSLGGHLKLGDNCILGEWVALGGATGAESEQGFFGRINDLLLL